MAGAKKTGGKTGAKGMPADVAEMLRAAEEQAVRGGAAGSETPPPLLGEERAPETPALSPEEMLAKCAAEPETDIGNGRRLLIRHGGHIIHVAHVGWHGYDGRRWKEDEDGSVVRPLAQRTAEFICDEARLVTATEEEMALIAKGKEAGAELKSIGNPKKDWGKDLFARYLALSETVDEGENTRKAVNGRKSSRHTHAKSSAGTTKINNMLIEAAPHVACMVEKLNTDLYALNVRNGTLRFRRVEDEESDPDDPRYRWHATLDRHDPADFISKLAPFDWKERAPHPELDAFLEKVQPDPEMRAFLQRLAGYIALGIIDEQIMVIFHGGGRNGKSTFVALLCHVLGDYSVTLDVESFTGENRRSGAEATPDLARLPGARLVASEEPDEGVRLKEGLIKRVTGGTKIPVRRLHQDFIEVLPQFTPVLSCNPKPEIRDMSEGLWRRILLVPWEVQIAKREIDRKLLQRLKGEAEGVLAWIVAGALEYLNYGLNPPKKVLAATDEYRHDSDIIGSFIRTACVVTGRVDDIATPADLFIAYSNWQTRSGAIELHKNTFFKRFPAYCQQYFEAPDGTMRQFSKDKSGTTIYRGLFVRDEFVRPIPPPPEERL
jgi:putative DNA primase/helicase